MDKLTLYSLSVWAFLFGLFTVTNIEVTWGKPLMGFAALVCGTICLIRALKL